jgi:hypothetical protein
MKRAAARLHPRALAAGAILLAAGCAARTAEHEEGSHALPPHHPGSFRRAIDEIERRGAAILAAPAGTADAAARAEFADIARWLPELAADTELGRADWERVAAVERALEGFPDGDAAAGLERWVAELRGAAAALPPEVAAAADTEATP